MTTTAVRRAAQQIEAVGTAAAPADAPPPLPDDPDAVATHLVAILRRSGRFRAWHIRDHTLPPDALQAAAGVPWPAAEPADPTTPRPESPPGGS